MAFGSGAVRISHKEGAVTRIDPTSNSIVARIPVDREARYLAVGAGAVWVTSFDLGTVQRIDPATNRVVKTIRLGFLAGPQGVAVRGSTVWVVTNATGRLIRIDARKNRVTARIRLPGSSGPRVPRPTGEPFGSPTPAEALSAATTSAAARSPGHAGRAGNRAGLRWAEARCGS
jgi:DNA-binding beta-propeller fold protein YncE